MLVTVLVILITNIYYPLTLAFGTNIKKMSSRSKLCHQLILTVELQLCWRKPFPIVHNRKIKIPACLNNRMQNKIFFLSPLWHRIFMVIVNSIIQSKNCHILYLWDPESIFLKSNETSTWNRSIWYWSWLIIFGTKKSLFRFELIPRKNIFQK